MTMYNVRPDRTTTRLIIAGPTPHTLERDNREHTILVQIEHQYVYENSILQEAKIEVHYRLLDTTSTVRADNHGSDSLIAHYRRGWEGDSEKVRITGSFGGAFLEVVPAFIRSRHVGTYLMNEIVHWAKQWPDADVYAIHLLQGQASTETNKIRRNNFYARFGIEFDFDDPTTQESGWSRPMKVCALNEVLSWKQNIKEIDLVSYLNSKHIQLAEYQLNARMAANARKMELERNALKSRSRLVASRPSRLSAAIFGAFFGFCVALVLFKVMNT